MFDYKQYWTVDGMVNLVPDGVAEGFDVVAALREFCDGPEWYAVTEIGCGNGRLSGAFAQYEYTGLDLNPHAIMEARRNHPGYQFQEIDFGESLNCLDGDLVLAYTVLLHIDDVDLNAVLDRICEDAGFVLICEIMDRKWRREGNPPAFNRTLGDYVDAMHDQGFRFRRSRTYDYARYAGAEITFAVFERND